MQPPGRYLNSSKTYDAAGYHGYWAWARRFLRWAYASVGVADFGCRGRCVVSVRLSGGRRLRGFVGWALYRAFETSMVGDMWRMLSVAEAFGVGSNRPLGLGAVRVTPLQ
jgi:Uncharacterized conserved protein